MEVKYNSRLMEYMIKEMSSYSRNNIKSLLKYKQVRVNGVAISQFNHLLEKGDVIEISKFRCDDELDILYEDEYFIAINKPANVLSVRNTRGEYTAISMIMKYVDKSNSFTTIYPLHRLDKATSGVLLVAKDENVKKQMQNNWNEIVKVRAYYGIVDGELKKSGKIISNLTESKDGYVYSSYEGKKAITNYKVVKKGKGYSILDLVIETGRKNQIRVHMKELGFPILGDMKYGEKSRKIKRLALHSYRLDFVHPITNKRININAKIPTDFNRF
ncbi:MAG: RluA family pseudouridine synthase [Bacilli bacterium]